MPELLDQMYCSQQIVIPPKYPYILKRYCKAAIKTQPYDLLRWSFEYFKALAEHRPPPVKLRLEYPIYSTEGGLTRGCLKVLAHQLYGMKEIPLPVLRQAWQGFCLDPMELLRILCLCEVYLREDHVSFFHFLAVAGGMLTKCLTHTMILLCESLTKEPDGGSAAIPVQEFLTMYRFLAVMDASTNVQYLDGYREGFGPPPPPEEEEEASEESDLDTKVIGESDDDYWDAKDLQRLSVIDDKVDRTAKLSARVTLPPIGKIERSPSIEKIAETERENYYRERIGKPEQSEEVNKKLRALSSLLLAGGTQEKLGEGQPQESKKSKPDTLTEEGGDEGEAKPAEEEEKEDEEVGDSNTALTERIQAYVEEAYQAREERLIDLMNTFEDIAFLVDKFNTAKYDLGMVAGRQMSTTSGEFIVQSIEKEIMAYINEQIAILPDPDLKKKKAKPEEVAMIREMLQQFLDDNMDIIVPEIEEEEEEEEPLPEIVMVYAVPGIGGTVDDDIIDDFKEYIKEVCHVQAEMVMPRNIRHFLCPPLEKYIDAEYEQIEVPTKEEVPTGGTINE